MAGERRPSIPKEMPPQVAFISSFRNQFRRTRPFLPTRERLFPYVPSHAIPDTLWSRILPDRAACKSFPTAVLRCYTWSAVTRSRAVRSMSTDRARPVPPRISSRVRYPTSRLSVRFSEWQGRDRQRQRWSVAQSDNVEKGSNRGKPSIPRTDLVVALLF